MKQQDAGQIKMRLNRLFKEHGKNFGCMNPQCQSSNTIGSHSVSKVFLKEIEETHHIGIFDKNNGTQESLSLEPITRASKFRGFCSDCDNRLFSPFESARLQLTREHLFLLAFRSVAKELHTKMSVVDFWKSELPPSRRNTTYHKLEELRLLLFSKLFKSVSEDFSSANYASFTHYAFEFEAPPCFLASGTIMPDILPSNRRVAIKAWQPFTINWVPVNSTLVCVISIHHTFSKKPKKLCQAFSRLNPKHTCLALLIMALDNIENIFFRPSFFDNLPDFEKEYLNKLFWGFADGPEFLEYPNFSNFKHFQWLPSLKKVTLV